MSVRAKFLAALLFACAAPPAAPAQTQARLNERACAGYSRADAELNQVYERVLAEYGGEADFVEKFRGAQRAWVAYRDAHLEALYPGQDKSALYGSVYPLCSCPELEALTRERVKLLRRWLARPPEGDVCAGSIRARPAKPTRGGRAAPRPRD